MYLPIQAQLFTSIASVIFSGVLVLVTYLYYRETKHHTQEMQKSREADFKPVVKPTIENWHAIHNRFAFENTGKGAAHDVTVQWGFNHLDYEKEWTIPLITPGQRHHFALPFDENRRNITTEGQIENELEGSEGILWFDVECTDSLGNEIDPETETINVLESIKSRAGEQLEKDELHETRKAIEDVSGAIEDVNGAVEMSGFEATLSRRNQEAVLAILEDNEDLTISELKDRSGLPYRYLAAILTRLDRIGIVEWTGEGHFIERESMEEKIWLSS
ncbi:hypothetical protein MUK72_01490 [Halococcus dombrowskii]|uniref:Uncharacterized protein n=2 Tax=Halococcus dombrowskii TaxID=179637 RepID=A0AAX3AR45_HALDO|nr:hypothetical protein [Halococcus dombrowskii]UOO95397.1 hypothetical protein MUK72_01490 [Halococcus dombrowskii]